MSDAMAGEQPLGPQPVHRPICDYLAAVMPNSPRPCSCPDGTHTAAAETVRPRLPLLYEHGVIALPDTPSDVAAGITIV